MMKKVVILMFLVVLFSIQVITEYHTNRSFKEIISAQPDKLAAQLSEQIIYTTSNPNLMNEFIHSMQQYKFVKTNDNHHVITKQVQLFDRSDKLIANIVFMRKGLVEIDGTTYKIVTDNQEMLTYFLDDFFEGMQKANHNG
jgi:hypothetical protein